MATDSMMTGAGNGFGERGDHELSERARQCRDQRLPVLLAAVRARRRGRQLVRWSTAAAAVVATALLLWQFGRRAGDEAPVVVRQSADVVVSAATPATAGPGLVIVRDDPTVLERCEVDTVDRAAWYVDDDGLQQMLAQAGLESGLVRAGGRLLLAAEVVAAADRP
jgi:hypothetical protein